MSATKKISLNQHIDKLGIIAGCGTLPRQLVQRAQKQGIECHVIGFKPHTNYVTPDFWGEIGRSSNILQYLSNHNINNLVFIGGVKKPNLWSLRPDWMTIKFFISTWWRSFGDSNVLTSARKTLEKKGFNLIGVHHFLPELIMPSGFLGCIAIPEQVHNDINLGLREAYELGRRDEGQAVIVGKGEIIARENKHGTNKMIEQYGQKGAVLVKLCKPQQDHDLDLPTIGPKTVQLCADKEMAGIVGHAGNMLVAEQEEVIRLADKHQVFVWGYSDEG